jgi:SAM-dependent MidA family methyltransferase
MARHDTPSDAEGEIELSADQAAHCAATHAHIAAQIAAAGGWLSFERYMDLALYAPGFGYYSAGASKFGAAGDFTTAPELSGLFGGCVARQCAEVLGAIGGGSIVEIGAGSGRLAVDVLRRLETLGQLPAAYAILEISAELRARQREHLEQSLPHLRDRLRWLDAPPAQPFEGVIIANEVLDALPVARFRWSQHLEELGVGALRGRFVWMSRPAGAAMSAACRRLSAAVRDPGRGGWDDGYVSEYCPRLGAWTGSMVRSLRRGAALWFDYGLPRAQYYLPERHEGTLICHFRHRIHGDPLRLPGLQDITAWVDFTALAEAAGAAGFEVAGFTSQALFLAGAGIEVEMQTLAQGDPHAFARLANQARHLMLPGEMGERFKAMAWTRGLAGPLSGFALQDLRHTL